MIFLIMFKILCQALDSGRENPRMARPRATSGLAGLQVRNRGSVICLPLCGKDAAARLEIEENQAKSRRAA
jgi:hypothetical protein